MGRHRQEAVYILEALKALISDYTAESGVRALEKRLAAIARKAVLAAMRGKSLPAPIEPEHLYDLLGLAPYHHDKPLPEHSHHPFRVERDATVVQYQPV